MIAERTFLAIYGMPGLQAAIGIDRASTQPLRKAPKSPIHDEFRQRRITELRARIPVGGLREAAIRSLLYAGKTRAAVDERGFEAVRRLREANTDLSLSDFKSLVREQFYMLLIDEETALAAIPSMLPADVEARRKTLTLIEQILRARGKILGGDQKRLDEVAQFFSLGEEHRAVDKSLGRDHEELQAKAS
jgi:hypothetical protein